MAGELIPSDFTHGYYEFKGQVGSEIVDLSDAGFNFTVSGAIDVGTGKFNNGLEFDGVNDQAVSAQVRYADFTDQLGICGWLQLLRTATTTDSYLWKGTGGGTGQDIFIAGVNDQVLHGTVNSTPKVLSASIGIAAPHFFALNYDGANNTIFWDDPGVNSATDVEVGNIRNTGDLVLGAITGNVSNGKCLWSQLGIRNAPFTPDELAFMYNGGVGRLLAEGVAGGSIINGNMAGAQLINGGIISV